MDLHRDEEVTAGELYNRAMISKQDLQAEHAGARRRCVACANVLLRLGAAARHASAGAVARGA